MAAAAVGSPKTPARVVPEALKRHDDYATVHAWLNAHRVLFEVRCVWCVW
jgi:hypothetical protein